MADLHFFMPMEPPTATAQEKQSTIGKDGKRRYYKNERLQAAEDKLVDGLFHHIPDKPLTGPIRLSVMWLYTAIGDHKHGEWRTSKPDTDNLDKMLKDVMTHLEFWKDDAQVVWEDIKKLWTEETPGIFVVIDQLDKNSNLARTQVARDRTVN